MCALSTYTRAHNIRHIEVSKTLMLPMRTKVTHVHYHLHKKICQIEVFAKHSYKATRLKILHFLLVVCNSHVTIL
jgi:hypothetical protein